jgi:murein DD-endopeptidase MepM/ murein hydrolase activator NlpD
VAVRGGKVKRAGYDGRLYGHFVLIGGRKTREQYFYSHLIEAPKVRKGERVRTGERIGRVGQTGNARSTPCHLHFELRISGRPIDPEPHLRRWDRWS